MLKVQEYLRAGGTVESLREDFGIKHDEDDHLVLLNYHQIDSPKTDPHVIECRGLILEKGTWDIVFFPFRRFFNYGEAENIYKEQLGGDSFFTHACALEKIDGSQIGLWHYRDKWRMSTRGKIDGVGEVPFGNSQTFNTLFMEIAGQYDGFWDKVDENITYVFELISPENRVVTPYDYKALYLIAARERPSNSELFYSKLVAWSEQLGVSVPEETPFTSVENLLEMSRELEAMDEGFVCVDYSTTFDDMSFSRIKVKNPAYVAIAHLKESSASSLRGLMQLVILGETEEFLSYFPEYGKYVTAMQEKYDKYVEKVQKSWDTLRPMAEDKTRQGRKEFALRAKETVDPGCMFSLYKGECTDFADYLRCISNNKGMKWVGKRMLGVLKIKDIEFNDDV